MEISCGGTLFVAILFIVWFFFTEDWEYRK